jgi:hypothetical protein
MEGHLILMVAQRILLLQDFVRVITTHLVLLSLVAVLAAALANLQYMLLAERHLLYVQTLAIKLGLPRKQFLII